VYVDADWFVGGTPTARLAVLGNGAEEARERAAGRALLRVAARAARKMQQEAAGAVEITGEGLVAGAVRETVGAGDRPDGRITAALDATGDPEVIAGILERLDDLGLLVLAGEPAGADMALDLYPDVHVRGLRLVGLSAAAAVASDEPVPVAGAALLNRWAAAARDRSGATAARWYRLA
jgi:hypothetical protein